MDKLQPIIKHHFWILCGLVIPVAMWGYYSANGALKEATVARETELSGVLSNIPQGTNDANEKYAEGLATINNFLNEEVEAVIVDLWKKQAERMTWPPSMIDEVPQNFLADEFTVDAGFIYKGSYELWLDELMQRIEPVYPLLMQEMVPQGQKQKVVLISDVPRVQLGQLAVKSQEIWDAQIDIWLTRLIFDAVRNTNADADTVSEAVVRRVDTFYLFGGSGEPLLPGATIPGMEGMDEDGGDYTDSGMDYGMAGEMGMGLGPTAVNSSVKFNPAEEFGPDLDSSAAMAGMGGDYGDSEMSMPMVGSAMAPRLRYIADSEEKPYLERGFYMSVIIMQNKIPDFLIELSNAPWPTRVTRFNIGDNPYRREIQPVYGGGSMAAYGLGDAYGMDEYGMDEYGTDGGYGTAGLGDYGDSGDYGDGGYGGFGMMGFGGGQASKPGKYSSGLPKYATDAMNHPDLVRMDLCGVITMYKQPESLKVPSEPTGEAGEQAAPDAPADDPTAEPAAQTAVDPGSESGGADANVPASN